MLEKIAEMVREEAKKANDDYGLMPCIACDGFPCEKGGCVAIGKHCPDLTAPNGSMMFARWAVLLVARGLSYEADGITPKIYTVGTLGDALVNLIAEAKEGKIMSELEKVDQSNTAGLP